MLRHKILNKLNSLLPNRMSPITIIAEGYNLIVSSRLHSLFLGICLNKKVIPLIYQEKVQNFVYENDMDSISIDVRRISPQSLYMFKSIFGKFKDDPDYYSSEIATIKEKCVIKSNKNFELLRQNLLALSKCK